MRGLDFQFKKKKNISPEFRVDSPKSSHLCPLKKTKFVLENIWQKREISYNIKNIREEAWNLLKSLVPAQPAEKRWDRFRSKRACGPVQWVSFYRDQGQRLKQTMHSYVRNAEQLFALFARAKRHQIWESENLCVRNADTGR